MTCYILRDNNKQKIGFICGDLGDHCQCGGIAEVLCDFPVGKGKTCNKKLCELCAYHINAPVKDSNIDFCHAHNAEWQEFLKGKGVEKGLAKIFNISEYRNDPQTL